MAEFRKLSEAVYVFLQAPLIWYSSAGVIIGDREVMVIDSLTNAAMTQSLLAAIRKVTDKPVRFLINTHSHADHVYTNHLFPDATVIGTRQARDRTKANQSAQSRHTALFAGLFPDVDFEGGRYTPQDMSFSESLTFYQGDREVRVVELGAGHSESDAVVHLPRERIVFCGDVFLNGLPPMPGEGRVSQTIAHYRAIEALDADVYVAGHGDPGTVADVRAQRLELESLFRRVRECYEQGASYDTALRTIADDGAPMGFRRLTILSSYCEFTGRLPESTDAASQNHLAVLQGIATEARVLLDGR